jgi:hypothetical protein
MLSIMMRADLMDGQEYAFREKRTVGSPLHRIKLLKHIRGRKWQARWIRPNAGLVDYVSAEQILVPWNEQAAYLKEERDRVLMWQHNLKHGFEASSPITYAVYTVIENSGENIGVGDSDIAATPERLERLKARAQLDHLQLCDIKPSYTDRMGRLHLPFETALELARAFCAAEPSAVIAVVEAEERQASYIATRPGQEHRMPLLNSMKARWALVRQWCGPDAALATRENRIAGLERLVLDAVYALQKAGLDGEANRLRRALS